MSTTSEPAPTSADPSAAGPATVDTDAHTRAHTVAPTVDDPTGNHDTLDSLRSERDEWRRRAEEAEAVAEGLAEELMAQRGHGELPLFEDSETLGPGLGVNPDGSDPRILPMVVAAVAVVMTMVALLSVVNHGLVSVVTIILVVIAAGLWCGVWVARSVPVKVSFVRSVVLVEERDVTHRFDLTEPTTRVDLVGEPGESRWRAYLSAPGVEDQTLDGRMVDAAEFVALCHTWRSRGA